jgi:hypothetical protein
VSQDSDRTSSLTDTLEEVPKTPPHRITTDVSRRTGICLIAIQTVGVVEEYIILWLGTLLCCRFQCLQNLPVELGFSREGGIHINIVIKNLPVILICEFTAGAKLIFD